MKIKISTIEPTERFVHPEVIDSLGRVIVLQKPGISNYLKFLKALGEELCKNQAYVELSSVVLLVKSIAGVEVIINSSDDVTYIIETLELANDAMQKILQGAADNFMDMESRMALINKEILKTTHTYIN